MEQSGRTLRELPSAPARLRSRIRALSLRVSARRVDPSPEVRPADCNQPHPRHRARAPARRTRPQAVDAIVPVPLHPSREARRGYNQAGEIARFAAEILGAAGARSRGPARARDGGAGGASAIVRRVNVSGAFESPRRLRATRGRDRRRRADDGRDGGCARAGAEARGMPARGSVGASRARPARPRRALRSAIEIVEREPDEDDHARRSGCC